MFMGFKLNLYDVFIMFPNVGYSDPGTYFHCPDHKANTSGIRVGSVTHENVQSWEACSQKCQDMVQPPYSLQPRYSVRCQEEGIVCKVQCSELKLV